MRCSSGTNEKEIQGSAPLQNLVNSVASQELWAFVRDFCSDAPRDVLDLCTGAIFDFDALTQAAGVYGN